MLNLQILQYDLLFSFLFSAQKKLPRKKKKKSEKNDFACLSVPPSLVLMPNSTQMASNYPRLWTPIKPPQPLSLLLPHRTQMKGIHSSINMYIELSPPYSMSLINPLRCSPLVYHNCQPAAWTQRLCQVHLHKGPLTIDYSCTFLLPKDKGLRKIPCFLGKILSNE